MICRKCKAEVPDGAYCLSCGAKQNPPSRKPKVRGNGQGSVYKRGKTWTAAYTQARVIKKDKNGDPVLDKRGIALTRPVMATKGGFTTKRAVVEYLPTLKESTKPKKHDNITFSQLYEKWLDRHKERVVKGTINCYKAAYNYYSDIYHMVFADLSTEDWQLCVDDCIRGKRTKQNMKALGTLMYGYAYELKITFENYAAHIYIPRMETESYNPFPDDIVKMILNEAEKGTPYADYLAILCFTGFRPSALLQMEKDNYNADLNALCGGIKTDAGRNRIVTLSPVITDLVKNRVKCASPYLFPRKVGVAMTEKYFREECFYPLLCKMGIQPMPVPNSNERPTYTPYSCRHTFGTMLKNIKAPDKDKAALMGHTSYEMTLHYQHEDIESIKSITDSLGASYN